METLENVPVASVMPDYHDASLLADLVIGQDEYRRIMNPIVAQSSESATPVSAFNSSI
jgi:hypothetical protein